MYKIWVGKRESDILTYKFFDCSITFYGSNQNNNYAYCKSERIHSSYNDKFAEFVVDILLRKISENQNIEIHFYNNTFAYKIIKINPALRKYIVNLNSLKILNMLNHKTISRLWLSNTIDTPAFSLLSKAECTIDNMQKKFKNFDSYIIQKNISGGGTGTYIVNKHNEFNVLSKLMNDELYLVSPYYYPNQSLSCHAVISERNIAVFPVSLQLIYTGNGNMEYSGNKYKSIDEQIIKRIKEITNKICTKMQGVGYRGICGFDFIQYHNQVMLIEINPRYQGSSYAINLALKEQNSPSLFEINTMCFNDNFDDNLISKINELNICYENRYLSLNNENDIENTKNILNDTKNLVFDDGFSNCTSFEQGVYLFRYLVFN